jgi:hypothetical protein
MILTFVSHKRLSTDTPTSLLMLECAASSYTRRASQFPKAYR